MYNQVENKGEEKCGKRLSVKSVLLVLLALLLLASVLYVLGPHGENCRTRAVSPRN